MRSFCPYCEARFDLSSGGGSIPCKACGRVFEAWVVPHPEAAPVVPLSASGGEVPRCAKHPNNAAVTACNRCGDFVCSVCTTYVDGLVICVKCFEFKNAQGDLASAHMGFSGPKWSLTMGIISLLLGWNCLGLVLGPAAVVTGIGALRTIRRQPALPGRGKAMAGIVLGIIGFLECVVIVGIAMWAEMRKTES